MSDNEIIKALECCAKLNYADNWDICKKECPYAQNCYDEANGVHFLKDLIDFINRQKAEIERYEKIVGKLAINKDGIAIGTLNGKQTEYIQKSVAEVFRNMAVNRAKAEAVKEFAERLKAKSYTNNYCQEIVLVDEIDTLVKEFTGGKTDE